MDLVRGGVEIIEQPLGVKRSAGSGDGDEDFQSVIPFAQSMAGLRMANKFGDTVKKYTRGKAPMLVEVERIETGCD